ncbi:5325_t:CDS:2 [Ambispora leptoticha]|uniref:5325_t:CDS:1 n=1 Tax=Ambispora leptoticha TaxID=144679 RepID=A0A9N9CLQ7_9GLOM|nr:5325_t:CDS:2 [Ambispora leptoticha]
MASEHAYREAFQLFDKKGNGTIPSEALGDLLRALGQNPTEAEVGELAKKAGKEVTYDAFLKILNRPDGFAPAGTYEDFIEGFQIFDKDRTGFIAASELKYVLTNLGEKLTSEEVDELFKNVEVDSKGNIRYEDVYSSKQNFPGNMPPPPSSPPRASSKQKLSNFLKEKNLTEAFTSAILAPKYGILQEVWHQLITECINLGKTMMGFRVFAEMKRRGVLPNEQEIYTTLIDGMAAKCHFPNNLIYTSFVIDSMRINAKGTSIRPTTAHGNALLSACNRVNDFKSLREHYDRLFRSGEISPNHETYTIIFHACYKSKVGPEGFKYVLALWNELTQKLEKQKQEDKNSEKKDEEGKEKLMMDDQLMTSFLTCCKNNGETKKGYEIIQKAYGINLLDKQPMIVPSEYHLQLSAKSLNIILEICHKDGAWSRGIDCFKLVRIKFPTLEVDIENVNTTISLYNEAKNYRGAFSLLEIIRDRKLTPSVQTYASLMFSCKQSKDLTMAKNLVEEMQQRQITPDSAVLSSLIDCVLGQPKFQIKELHWALDRIEGFGLNFSLMRTSKPPKLPIKIDNLNFLRSISNAYALALDKADDRLLDEKLESWTFFKEFYEKRLRDLLKTKDKKEEENEENEVEKVRIEAFEIEDKEESDAEILASKKIGSRVGVHGYNEESTQKSARQDYLSTDDEKSIRKSKVSAKQDYLSKDDEKQIRKSKGSVKYQDYYTDEDEEESISYDDYTNREDRNISLSGKRIKTDAESYNRGRTKLQFDPHERFRSREDKYEKKSYRDEEFDSRAKKTQRYLEDERENTKYNEFGGSKSNTRYREDDSSGSGFEKREKPKYSGYNKDDNDNYSKSKGRPSYADKIQANRFNTEVADQRTRTHESTQGYSRSRFREQKNDEGRPSRSRFFEQENDEGKPFRSSFRANNNNRQFRSEKNEDDDDGDINYRKFNSPTSYEKRQSPRSRIDANRVPKVFQPDPRERRGGSNFRDSGPPSRFNRSSGNSKFDYDERPKRPPMRRD